jgi:hypothetical protein
MYAGICIYNQQYQERPVGGNGTLCMGAVFVKYNEHGVISSKIISIEKHHKVGLRIELTFLF